MKAIMQPLYFTEANDREKAEYAAQMEKLQQMYGDVAEFLEPLPVDSRIPSSADAILMPQLFGAVFAHKEDMTRIKLPIVVLTSQFGTVEMWDWEIVAYLREELSLNVFTPYNEDIAKTLLRAMAAKTAMKSGLRFLMLQDTPGEGMQANIFKRFYWWEEESRQRIENAFGVEIVYRSWKELNERAAGFSDEEAWALWLERPVPCEDVPRADIIKAVKIYLAVKKLIDELGNIQGVGANCLNESFLSASTPCLAWNWIFEHDHLIWVCEGDTVTMISKFVLYSALKRPIMMTNIYPFLVGMAALKHEKIDQFPDIEDPDRHALGVHCGYFGLTPQSFCTHWTMRPKVLGIVNDNAIVLDCRMATGPVTMAKLHPDMHTLTVIEAEIEDYVQYPGSDCRNGALIRYSNDSGHGVMEKLSSHHAILIQGNVTHLLTQIARVYGFKMEVI